MFISFCLKDQLAKLDFARWTLIPLTKPEDHGKRPLDNNWTTRDYDSRDVLARCIKDKRNVGIRLMAEQLVIDVDPRNGGDEGFAKLCLDTGLKDDALPCVMTGSGGRHYFLTKPDTLLVVDTLEAYPGVEFKSKGRQVVAAGSVHPKTGKAYKWRRPLNGEPPQAPQALLDLIARPERSGNVTGGGQYSQEQIAHALSRLDVTKFRDHDQWLKLMMAVHHASNGDAREEFVDWSTNDPHYAQHSAIIGRRWDSLHAKKPGGVTFRTLNKILADHGAADAQAAPDAGEDFDAIGPSTSEIAPVAARGLAVNRASRAPDTFANALAAVTASGLDPAWDELKQNVLLRAATLPWDESYGRVLNDHVLRLIRVYVMQRNQGVDFQPSVDNLYNAIATVAYAHKFNPIIEYLDGLTWDGTPRVEKLFSAYFGCADDAYTREVSKAFMIGAVRRQRHPGCKFDTLPILQGAQGIGKSRGVQTLFGAAWTSDADLGNLRDKDSALKLLGIWCQELAELETMNRAESGQLKAFLSRATDRQRNPYGRVVEDQPRRCVFVGTCNEGGFLKDSTGARRFWPLQVINPVALDRLAADRDQLWAEAADLERRGASEVLNPRLWAEAANRQADQTSADPWADILADFLDQRARDFAAYDTFGPESGDDDIPPPPANRVHTSEIFSALGLSTGELSKDKSQRVRVVMENILGWKHKRNIRLYDRIGAGYVKPPM